MGHPGEDAGEVLAAFIADIGMPRSLAAVKIGPENFTRLAEQAMDTPWVPRNPRPIASPVQSSNWPPKRNALAGPGENLQWDRPPLLAARWLICEPIGAD